MFGMHVCIIRRPIQPGFCPTSLGTLGTEVGTIHSGVVLHTTACGGERTLDKLSSRGQGQIYKLWSLYRFGKKEGLSTL
jgi:hypothetical protein